MDGRPSNGTLFKQILAVLAGLLVFGLDSPAWGTPLPIPQGGPPIEEKAVRATETSPLPTATVSSETAPTLTSALHKALTPEQIVRLDSPAVVTITSVLPREGTVRGSGFFVGSEGLVVTSYHLVDDAHDIRVKSRRGHLYEKVRVVGAQPDSDVAVLRVETTPEGEPFLPVGNSDDLRVGEHVVAIGHPLGLEYTLSEGLVSALRHAQSHRLDLIQFSAPVSPGSSGGPLINDAGEVVGIISLSHPEGQNINFAVPVKYALGVIAHVPMGDGLPGTVATSVRLAGVSAHRVLEITDDAPARSLAPTAIPDRTARGAAVPAGVDLVPPVPVVQIAPPVPHRRFEHANRGFDLACPDNWEIHSSENRGTLIVHMKSADASIQMDFVSLPVAPRTTLERFASHVLSAVRANLLADARGAAMARPAFSDPAAPHLVRDTVESVAGVPWHMYVHRSTSDDGTDLYSVAMASLSGAQGYVVRYSVPVERWGAARSVVREVLGGVSIF